MNKPSKPSLQMVVGVHRSGTSAATQILSTLGLDLGQTLMLPAYDNPRGFWENHKIIQIHDQLLSTLGVDWTTAAGLPENWIETGAAKSAIEDLIEVMSSDFRNDSNKLVKDPRLTVLLPLWAQVSKGIGHDLRVMAVLRSPQKAQASIIRRNGFSVGEAHLIINSQLTELKRVLNRFEPPVLVYERLTATPTPLILDAIISALPHLNLTVTKAMTDLVDRIIGKPFDFGPSEDVAYRDLLEKDRQSPIISWETARTFLESVSIDGSNLEGVASLLPPNSKDVLVPSFRLEELNREEEELQRLGERYERLESELKDARSQVQVTNLELIELKQQYEESAFSIATFELDKKSAERKQNKLVKKLSSAFSEIEILNETQIKLRNDISNQKKREKSAKLRHTKRLEQAKQESRDLNKKLADVGFDLSESHEREKELRIEVEEKSKKVTLTSQDLKHTLEKFKNIEGLLTSTQDQLAKERTERELMNTTRKIEKMRVEMVEKEFSAKVRDLEHRLDYFERAPLRVGLKSFLFLILRYIRRGLPLPEDFKMRIAQRMTRLAVRLRPPSQWISANSLAKPRVDDIVDFAFLDVEDPVISIIVPVYNEISQTITCLKSIFQQRVSVSYEVIVADDASPDPFHMILRQIPGLRYIRQPKNLNFLLNCNHAAKHARGDYLVFLNNDTIVQAGWLENLYATYREHDNVGVVGSKLIYPTGELQEAGGIIWEDATGWNWGKGESADHPSYNFFRDVDYVSGASLMIPTFLWREIGGFDEILENAYYEDTDLCFKSREMGYRVVYQPSSVVTHIEGLSSGNDPSSGAKRYQLINQKIFMERWADRLRDHGPNAQEPFLASDRSVKGHILYIDAKTPEPDMDSGSIDSFYTMRILIEQGYRVHFIPGSNFAFWREATAELQKIGIECIYHPFYSNIDMFLDERGDMFDFVVMSRAECAEKFLGTITRRLPKAKTVYNTVDVHFLRMQREAAIKDNADILEMAEVMRVQELSYIEETDVTIVLSSKEKELLAKLGVPREKLWLIPLIRAHSKRIVEFETSKDMVFIGGYDHPPNVDAVHWLMESIWPHIESALPGVNLRICGSYMPESFNAYSSNSVIVQGFVPDLDALLSKTRLTLAPLRFGAGLKGKVASSIGAGVPVVGTSIAFEGMVEDRLSEVILQADDPKAFAKLAVQAYTDKNLWMSISFAGVEYHNENYAYQNVSVVYAAMLDWVQNGTVAADLCA